MTDDDPTRATAEDTDRIRRTLAAVAAATTPPDRSTDLLDRLGLPHPDNPGPDDPLPSLGPSAPSTHTFSLGSHHTAHDAGAAAGDGPSP